MFRAALKEAKLGFGEKDARAVAALNNLAELARTQRMWEKAEGLYKECLDLLRELKKTTPNSSSSSSSSDNSSKVDKRKGAEYKAEATIAAALHNLASCMLQNNKPKEAYENYRTSLNLKQVVFENENHPEIALTLHHMAEALLLLEHRRRYRCLGEIGKNNRRGWYRSHANSISPNAKVVSTL